MDPRRMKDNHLREGSIKRSATIQYPGTFKLLLVWLFVGTVSYARYHLQTRPAGPHAFFEFLLWQTCFLPWIGLSPLVFRLEKKYPLGGAQWLRNLGVLGLAGVPFSYVSIQIALALSLGVEFLFSQPLIISPLWWRPTLQDLWVILLLYWGAVAGSCVIRSLMLLQQREQETAELALQKSQLESSLRQAELETLRTRLNPHFLFNCLQNIAVLTQEDPKTANQMLTRLGELLRTALRGNSGPETTLKSEIALTKSYVAVEQMRFGERLSVLFDIAPDTETTMVPTFLLQPLVENAIVHGLRDTQRGGIISIRSAIDNGSLALTVIDNGTGLPANNGIALQSGVGLSSTCERLARMYPQQHSFSMRPLPEGGTEVLIVIPLRFQPSYTETPHEQTSLIDR